jgi:acetylornithine aminotransferase
VTDGAKYEEGARRAGLPLSVKVPFNDAAAMERTVDSTTAAVIVEPVQGLTGARDCSREFLDAARRACTRTGAALIFDEVQCGIGRSGSFTAAEAFGVTPDIITMAKGLASGFPIGAMVATSALTSGLVIGDLGSTFGGGPVACAAAIATLEVIEREDLLLNVHQVGSHLRAGAARLGVREVRGRGLLLGLQMSRPAAEVQQALFGQKVLVGTASDPATLRLLPALSFSSGEADLLLDALGRVLA